MSPLNVNDILERAKNSFNVGDYETAERLLRNYIAKVPESREAYLLLGNTFAREGKLTDAEDQFITLLARDPKDLDALNNAAVICRRQGNFQRALNYLREAIELDSGKAEFHYNLGNIQKEMGNLKAASLAYSRVIELDPNYVLAYNNLGIIYDQLKDYDKAFSVFRKGLALDQNNPILHFNYGVALETNGRLDDAANEYNTAIRSKPGWLEPMNKLGMVLFAQGQHDKALSTFNRVLHADPSNVEARNNMGIVLSEQGRTQEAIKNFRIAIETNPKYTNAMVNLGQVLEAAGDYADAVVEMEKLVKLSPDNAKIRNRLSSLYLKLERYPEALRQAEEALKLDDGNIQALRIKGAIMRVMGNDAEAQACFEKILSIDPGDYTFLLDLADIHFHRKEYKEAEERVHSYLAQKPNDREAKMLLGRMFAEMGNRAHAIQIFEELSKADPNDTEALAAVAELHKEAGSVEKALRTADTLVNLQGKRATAEDLTDLNNSLKLYEGAVHAYSSSVRELWDRNLKLISEEEEEKGEKEISTEDDLSLLMGNNILPGIDEEPEALFTEEADFFPNEDEEDLFLGNGSYGEIPEANDFSEEEGRPKYKDPLDALAEPEFAEPTRDDPFKAPDGKSCVKQPEPPNEIQVGPANEIPGELPKGIPGEAAKEIPGEPTKGILREIPNGISRPPENYNTTPLTFPSYPQPTVVLEVSPMPWPPPERQPLERQQAQPTTPEPPPHLPQKPETPPIPFEEEEETFEVFELEDEAPEEKIQQDEILQEPEEPLEEIPSEIPLEEPIEEPLPLMEELPEEETPEDLTPEELTLENQGNEEPEPTEDNKQGDLSKVVDLLGFLHGLTDALPEEQRKTYSQGKLQTAMGSVIDSLKNLTIIKETKADVSTAGAVPEVEINENEASSSQE